MKITVCIGSSCHLKGSRRVVEQLQDLIATHQLGDQIELAGTFCLANCQRGVSVMLDEQLVSLTPETTQDFFSESILPFCQVRP